MDTSERTKRAKSFEVGAVDYERLRPDFPSDLFVDLQSQAGDRLAGRVLEVGAGTGRATLPLARLGATVDVVEPSQDMLDVLGERLRADGLDGRVRSRRARFEDVDPRDRYDVVVAAQSFHWAAPATRWTRLADLVRPDGLAFLFWNGWSLDPQRCDIASVADVYDRLGEGLQPDLDARRSTVGWAQTEIEAEPALQLLSTRTYASPMEVDVHDYLGLLATTSQYAVATPAVRDRLFDALVPVLGPRVALRGRTLFLAVGPNQQ